MRPPPVDTHTRKGKKNCFLLVEAGSTNSSNFVLFCLCYCLTALLQNKTTLCFVPSIYTSRGRCTDPGRTFMSALIIQFGFPLSPFRRRPPLATDTPNRALIYLILRCFSSSFFLSLADVVLFPTAAAFTEEGKIFDPAAPGSKIRNELHLKPPPTKQHGAATLVEVCSHTRTRNVASCANLSATREPNSLRNRKHFLERRIGFLKWRIFAAAPSKLQSVLFLLLGGWIALSRLRMLLVCGCQTKVVQSLTAAEMRTR